MLVLVRYLSVSTLSAIMIAVATNCGPSEPAAPQPAFEPAGPEHAPDPSTFGPFPVGVRTLSFEIGDRTDPDGSPRTLVTEIWYPAVEESRGLPGEQYDLRVFFTPEQTAQFADTEFPLLPTQAVRDAAPWPEQGPFPLVIFSHGKGAFRWQSTYFTVLLASHGYVVASADHSGDTFAEMLRNEQESTLYGAENRPLDVSFLISRMGRLPEDEPLRGLADTERVGVAGHSFGAFTSLRVAVTDKRIKAIVPHTPTSTELAWLGLPQPVTLDVPVMMHGGRADQTLAWDEHVGPAWASLSRPRFLLELPNGGHFTWSDLCSLDLSRFAGSIDLGFSQEDVERSLKDGCAAPAPPADVAQPLINHFSVGFFNGYLRNSPGALEALSQAEADRLAPGEAVVSAEP